MVPYLQASGQAMDKILLFRANVIEIAIRLIRLSIMIVSTKFEPQILMKFENATDVDF